MFLRLGFAQPIAQLGSDGGLANWRTGRPAHDNIGPPTLRSTQVGVKALQAREGACYRAHPLMLLPAQSSDCNLRHLMSLMIYIGALQRWKSLVSRRLNFGVRRGASTGW